MKERQWLIKWIKGVVGAEDDRYLQGEPLIDLLILLRVPGILRKVRALGVWMLEEVARRTGVVTPFSGFGSPDPEATVNLEEWSTVAGGVCTLVKLQG